MFQHLKCDFKKFGMLLVLSFILIGCKSSAERSEEKLFDACISGLKKELKTWAKYDGWSVDNATAKIYKMVPDIQRNTKYETDQFWSFEVLISDFTVKNGFNANINSISSCTGFISKDSDGGYEPPAYTLHFTLNGKKIGI